MSGTPELESTLAVTTLYVTLLSLGVAAAPAPGISAYLNDFKTFLRYLRFLTGGLLLKILAQVLEAVGSCCFLVKSAAGRTVLQVEFKEGLSAVDGIEIFIALMLVALLYHLFRELSQLEQVARRFDHGA